MARSKRRHRPRTMVNDIERPLSPLAKKLIETWESRTDWRSQSHCSGEAGAKKYTFSHYKRRYPEFRRRFEAHLPKVLGEDHLHHFKTPEKDSAPLPPEVPEGALEKLLAHYEENGQRVDAARAAGFGSWAEAEQALGADKEALARFKLLRKEEEMRIEDSLRLRAASGDSPALNALYKQGVLDRLGDRQSETDSGGNGYAPPDERLERFARERLGLLASLGRSAP